MRNLANKPSFVQGRRPETGAGPRCRQKSHGPGRPERPLALLVFPPVHDFALYDLFVKPYSLLRLGGRLLRAGYRVCLVNALETADPASRARLGVPRRKADGTGKFFRQPLPLPAVLAGQHRRYGRYGILEESLRRQLSAENPEVVLVSSGMTYWYPGVVEAVRLVRSVHPRAPIVLGGVYATLCADHARRVVEADHVLPGDGLETLPPLLARLGLPPAGDAFREAGEPGPLALLPQAGWEAAALRLNRGCRGRCRYCAAWLLDRSYRRGDPESAFAALTEIHRRFGTCSFAFYDDALLEDAGSVLVPFLERVVASGLPLSFRVPNAVHLQLLNPSLARLMRRAGFREIRLGLESLSPAFHARLDRKLDPALLEGVLATLREAGFGAGEVAVYLLAGLPGQRREEVEESIRGAASLGVRVMLAEYSPAPGSGLWQEAVRRSRFPLAEEPLTHNNSILPMQWEGFSPRDLQELKLLARSLSSGCD